MSGKRPGRRIYRNTQTASPAYRDMEYYRLEEWKFLNPSRWPLYPAAVEETRRRVPFWFEEKFSRFLSITMLLNGRIVYRTAGKKIVLQPGKLLLLPVEQEYFFESRQPYHKLVLELRGEHLSSLSDALGLRKQLVFVPEHIEEFIAEFRKIETMLRNRNEADIPELMGICYRLLHQLSLNMREKGLPSKQLALAKSLLESRLAEPFSLEALSIQLGMSQSTLNRLFLNTLGMSPYQYRIACKIEAAREYLQHTGRSVKEIAYQLGYCSQFYFAAEFRRMTGVSPTRYRNGMRSWDRPVGREQIESGLTEHEPEE